MLSLILHLVMKQTCGQDSPEWLVKWKGYEHDHNTWEGLDMLE
jgi:hypothetical protein